jgi:NADPH2:quinone reductase
MNFALHVHETGGPEVMQWEECPVGEPGHGEVRLRHTAIGVNFIDVYYRTGLYPAPRPFIPGREGAGIVEAVGPGVNLFKAGDRVAYASVMGSYSQERLIAADQLVMVPDGVDDRTAAAITLQGMTARYLIKQVYRVTAGETILVHAAAGGVGQLLCQWASHLGATVIGTVSSDEKAAIAAGAGCHYPVVIGREDFVARVAAVTDGEKVPVVYDSVGRDTFEGSLDCLRPLGMMVVFGQSSGTIPPFEINLLARKGSLVLTRPVLSTFISTRATLEATAADVYDAVASGILKPAINQTYSLRDAAKAHRDLEARRTTGSTVLLPS